MTGQGGAAREGLLAIGIGTLVRALARVDPTMPCQGARVAEGLGQVLEGWLKRATPGTYLSATLTHMGLLARVDTLVNSQGGALDELLAAVGVLAHVRADTTVDAFWKMLAAAHWGGAERSKLLTVTRKVTASRESLAARRAGKGLGRPRV